MKMRKIFAILLSTALLMALAIVPANAAFKTDYTNTYAIDSTDGYFVEGTVTAEDGYIAVSGAAARLATDNNLTVTATSVTLKVTAGAVYVNWQKNYSGTGSFNVLLNADGTYRVYYGALSVTSNIATGEFDASQNVTVSLAMDATTAVVTVNNTEHEIDIETAAPELVNFNCFQVYTNQDATAVAEVYEFKTGTALASIEDGSTDVEIGVKPTITPEDYLEVTIVAGEFNFVYTPETYRWDAEANEYVVDVPSSWDQTTDTIVVTNLSSVAVDVEVTSTVAANTDGVTFSLDVTEDTLAAATAELEDSVTITGTIGGVPGSSYETSEDGSVLTNIGTITVNVYRA